MNSSSKFSLFAAIILLITSGCTDNPYRDEDVIDKTPVSYGVLVHPMTNNHSAAPGFDTDFILTVYNIGSETETFDITILNKDEGIESVSFEGNVSNLTVPADETLPLIANVNLAPSATGKLKTDIKFSTEPNEENITISQTITLEVNADVTFGNQTKIGDQVKVHYAGILAKDSKLFDSSMEYVWDTYPYYNFGVSEDNRHIETLSASNIGCFFGSTKDGVILSYVDTSFSAYEGGLRVGMEIYEFNTQKINTYDEFYDAINATFANQTVNISVINETAGLDNYTVNMTDLGEFYEEFYPYYYQTWMDGKGFMGINAEEKTALNSEDCAGSRVMITGFDNKMVGMYEGQTLAIRMSAKDAYGESGYSALAGEDLLFLIEMVEIIESEEEPEEESEKPENTYSCEISSEGFCIFAGTPHKQGLEPGTDNIVDREGNYLFGIDEALAVNSEGTTLQARGTPAFDGDQLIQSSQEGLSEDEKAFHKVMAIMFPIRNALMYDIASVNQDEWNLLVNELETREIKETTFTDGQTPKDNYYGRQGIFDLAKNPNGKDIHHDVMKFLEESGLYLLCHVTSDDFAQMLADTHPEGHEPCEDAGITIKVPFDVTQDYNMTVTDVIDGDTFYLGNGDKVRMLGINTPESGRPYAQEATDFLTNMILGKEVTLVNDSKNGDSDSYGRLLAHVYVDDTFVNYEIIKAGYAFWYPYTSGTDLDTEYEEAQEYASNNTVGLWTESSYNLTIDYIEYDPEDDETVGEYLVLTNHENYNVSMVGWFLQDEAAQTAYEFNFTISNNSSIRIYTGDGTDNSTTLYWGWHQGIWNNSGDFAIIQDENGYLVDSYRYD